MGEHFLILSLLLLGLGNLGSAQNPEQITIPAGTKFKARLETPISSKISEVGDRVVVTLAESVPVDSQHILPRGIEMTGKITQVKRAGQVKGKAEVYALINEMTTRYGSESIAVSIDAADDYVNDEKIHTDEEGKLKSNRDIGDDVKKAGAGAGLGSIATAPVAIATSNVGAAIAGPAAGALAGLLLTRGKEIRLAAGTIFRMKFDKPLVIPLSLTQEPPHVSNP
ncbi:MAG: hypothetical protein U0V70_00705 [Terriglobia bacterium]